MATERVYRVSPRDLIFSRTGAWLLFAALVLGGFLGMLPPKGGGPMTRQDHIALGVALAAIFYPLFVWSIRFGQIRFGDGTISLGGSNRRLGVTFDFSVAEVVRFEVRHWSVVDRAARLSPRLLPKYQLSLLIADGTWVPVPSFSRAPGFGGSRRRILGRDATRRPARAVRLPDGRRLAWTVDNDHEIEAYFNARLDEVRRTTARSAVRTATWAPPQGLRQLSWDVHRRQPPAKPAERRYLSEAIHGRVEAPVVEPTATQLPPRPRTSDGLPVDTAAAQVGGEVVLPTRFWTLASDRSGHAFGRRSSMLISRDGVTFERRLRRDLQVRLAEIDRFDIALDIPEPRDAWDEEEQPAAGKWRLLLFRTDGTTVPLSGLSHGYFKGNRLHWTPGDDARRRTAAGSLPWDADDTLVIAARLNAYLEVARASA